MNSTGYNPLPPQPTSPASRVPTTHPASTVATTPLASTAPTTLLASTAPPTPPALTILDQSSLDNLVTRSLSEYTFDLKNVTLDLVLELIQNRRELLVHPVVETFLSVIWQKSNVRKLFIVLFIVHLFLLIGSAVLIGILGNPIWQPKANWPFAMALWVVWMFMLVYMVSLECFKLRFMGGTNYLSWRNIFTLLVTLLNLICWCFLSSFVFVNHENNYPEDYQWSLELGQLLVLFGTMNLISKLADFPLFGNVVYCVLEVLLSLSALMTVYVFPLLIAFGFLYHIRLDKEASFGLQHLITRPLSMMIGVNIAVIDFLTPLYEVTIYSVEIVLIMFICLMCITCNQFLHSLTVNRMDFYLQKAALSRLQNTAINCHAFYLSDHKLNHESLMVEKRSTQSFYYQFICLFVHAQRHYELATPTIFYKATENNHTVMFLPSWILDQAEDILNELDLQIEKNSEKEIMIKEQENMNKQFKELTDELKTSNQDKKCLKETIDTQQDMIKTQQEMIKALLSSHGEIDQKFENYRNEAASTLKSLLAINKDQTKMLESIKKQL